MTARTYIIPVGCALTHLHGNDRINTRLHYCGVDYTCKSMVFKNDSIIMYTNTRSIDKVCELLVVYSPPQIVKLKNCKFL